MLIDLETDSQRGEGMSSHELIDGRAEVRGQDFRLPVQYALQGTNAYIYITNPFKLCMGQY